MRILQVSTADTGGGAEAVARDLHDAYNRRGHDAWLAVGAKRTGGDRIVRIPSDELRPPPARAAVALAELVETRARGVRGAGRAARALEVALQPRRLATRLRGREDFDFPGTRRLLDLPPGPPELVHCHNLHGAWLRSGGYFDLGALPQLARRAPVFLTLHDEWLLTGHCAYSLDSDRWRTGCGECPYLHTYPAVARDATALNWRRKQAIFSRLPIRVATPSRWLLDRVERSLLAPAVVDARVIPNGVDLDVFAPASDPLAIRERLGLALDAFVLLFAATSIRRSDYKDFRTLRAALELLGRREREEPIVLVALGEAGPGERLGAAELRFVPWRERREDVAAYYQGADVYVHATLADTFPTTVLEALACGVPVVASRVGGVPEQVDELEGRADATGLLVPPRDARALAAAVETLVEGRELRRRLGENAARTARARFDFRRVVDDYLAWYRDSPATSSTTRSSRSD